MVNGIESVYLQGFWERRKCAYATRSCAILIQSYFKTQKYGFSTIKPQGGNICNGLSNEIKDACNFNTLKSLLVK